MLFLAFAGGLIAAKKSDICIPESSNCIKSAGVMPCPCAISNNSARAHSISSGLGSAGCRLLFIVCLYNCHALWLGPRHIHPIVQDCRWLLYRCLYKTAHQIERMP